MSSDKKKIEFVIEMMEDIETYLTRFDSVTTLLDDKMGFNATLMNLMQIGETPRKLQGKYTELDNDDIKGAYDVRNFIAHDYEGIRKSIIESIIREHLPKLKNALEKII